MVFGEGQFVSQECTIWYVRPDQLVHLCTTDGARCILNSKFTKLWLNIGYGKSVLELWNCIKDDISLQEMEEMLEQLALHRVVKVVNVEDQFDVIFG